MSLSEQVDDLQKQVTELKDSFDQATHETSAQVKARIDKLRADIAARPSVSPEKAGQAAGHAQSQWQAMKADNAAKMRDLHDRIARKRDQHDVKKAENDAGDAEGDASFALDYASWVIDQVQLAVLDAVDARSWADARAAASSPGQA
jgi:peptidoglycan hydrolase CwlO-like protein